MNELWSRSVANIHKGRLQEFKRLAEGLLSAIRENDSDTLNYAIFLDEPARVAVIVEQYASSAGWLAHNANLNALMPRFRGVCEFAETEFYGDPMRAPRSARATTRLSWRSSGGVPKFPRRPLSREKGQAMRYLGKAALAGAATGQRATSAVSALITAQAPGLPVALTRPVAAGVAQLGVTGELEQDKKPSTPSRLTPV